MTADVIVVARRWDGLGGRLQAIFNAWSIARALDLEFRFVWPRNSFESLHEPREIFDETFLSRFEITESAWGDCIVLPAPTVMSLLEARAHCRAAPPDSMIDVWECFDVLCFADESAAAAGARFRAGLGEIAWSGVAGRLVESVSLAGEPGGYSVIHVRAGDIVSGDWRQFVPVQKYIPTAFVERAIETLGGPDAGPVVVVSDNEQYVHSLKTRFDFIRSPGDVVSGYADLSEAQRAFADILVLSRARRLFGPFTSAFSRLAANLGGLEMLNVGELLTGDTARRLLADRIEFAGKEAARREVVRPLLARDICWYLDVFPEHLSEREYLGLARRATRCEPDFCGALNRLAAAEAYTGNPRGSAVASARASRAAGSAEIHADPLVESLATSISARVVIAFGARRRGDRSLAERFGLAWVLERIRGGGGWSFGLDEIGETLTSCEALTPYQTDHEDVMANLRFQVAALNWLMTADERSREMARQAMNPAKDGCLLPPSWRPSGFGSLSEPRNFSQTLRNVEIATIRIARAIAASLPGALSRPPRMGHIELIRTSPSGLRWVVGWAYDPALGRSGFRIGLASNDGAVSGGTTFLPRPDVAAALDEPLALHSGFAFPVPSTAFENADVLQAKLCIFNDDKGAADHNLT